jgi:hypothetical protein
MENIRWIFFISSLMKKKEKYFVMDVCDGWGRPVPPAAAPSTLVLIISNAEYYI